MSLLTAPRISLSAGGIATMDQKHKRRADTALFLARIKRRSNTCVRVLGIANWLAP